MNKSIKILGSLLVLTVALASSYAVRAGLFSKSIALTPSEMKFEEFPVLPAGAKVALVKGNWKTGPFTVIVKVPAGFVMPPHSHPDERTIIVISGTLYQGEGDQIDEKTLKAFPSGSVIVDPARESHYHIYKEDTVFAELGTSPTAINYANPADSPLRK
jgi:quercetin dioxygenase-like cupin family protein